MQKQPGQHCHCPLTSVATSHGLTPLPSPLSPPSSSKVRAQLPENFLRAQAGRSTECVRQTSPRLLASLSPTWASSTLPLPPAPRVGVSTSPRQRRGRAVGEWEWGWDRDVNLSSLFFFSPFLPLGLGLPTLFLCCTCTSASRPYHALIASFFSPSFLPVSSRFFSVASRFVYLRPAFLLQGNQYCLLDLSKRETEFPRASSRESLLNP